MGKLAARQMGSAEELEADLAGGGGGAFIKFIGDEPLVVRFIEEPTKWVGYKEYFDAERKRSIPMEEDEQVPDTSNISKRYLAEVIVITDDDDNGFDEIVPLKMPKSLASDLYETMKLTGSVTDRDFTLLKTGKGMQTRYKNLPSTPMPRPVDKYERLDLIQILEDARAEALGVGAIIDADDVDDEDEGPGSEAPTTKATKAAAPAEPTEVASTGDDSTGDKLPSLEEMLAMDRDELAAVCDARGIAYDAELRKGGLIDVLINAAAA